MLGGYTKKKLGSPRGKIGSWEKSVCIYWGSSWEGGGRIATAKREEDWKGENLCPDIFAPIPIPPKECGLIVGTDFARHTLHVPIQKYQIDLNLFLPPLSGEVRLLPAPPPPEHHRDHEKENGLPNRDDAYLRQFPENRKSKDEFDGLKSKSKGSSSPKKKRLPRDAMWAPVPPFPEAKVPSSR